MKLLDGNELAGFIKERQAKQVRALRQAKRVFPVLAVVQTTDDPVIDTYVRMKKQYGADILVDVAVHKVSSAELMATIETLNGDDSVHGIIIQLPLADTAQTQAAVDAVAPQKDVDGLGVDHIFDPATALAINWLAAGYNIVLKDKKIAIVGNGRLVGAPLAVLWQKSGYESTIFDSSSKDLAAQLKEYDVIVTATGVPGLITSEQLKDGAVVIDAGTAAEHGKVVGDVADDVRTRDDLTITPLKGGVGPLTVTALFDNVISAATATAKD